MEAVRDVCGPSGGKTDVSLRKGRQRLKLANLRRFPINLPSSYYVSVCSKIFAIYSEPYGRTIWMTCGTISTRRLSTRFGMRCRSGDDLRPSAALDRTLAHLPARFGGLGILTRAVCSCLAVSQRLSCPPVLSGSVLVVDIIACWILARRHRKTRSWPYW